MIDSNSKILDTTLKIGQDLNNALQLKDDSIFDFDTNHINNNPLYYNSS